MNSLFIVRGSTLSLASRIECERRKTMQEKLKIFLEGEFS